MTDQFDQIEARAEKATEILADIRAGKHHSDPREIGSMLDGKWDQDFVTWLLEQPSRLLASLRAENERLKSELTTCQNTAKINLSVAQTRGADLERMRAALEPFANYAPANGTAIGDHFVITKGSPLAKRQLTMGDCRAAKVARSPHPPSQETK